MIGYATFTKACIEGEEYLSITLRMTALDKSSAKNRLDKSSQKQTHTNMGKPNKSGLKSKALTQMLIFMCGFF